MKKMSMKDMLIQVAAQALYERGAENALLAARNASNEEERKKHMDQYKRAIVAMEVAKLDVIAADNIFHGIEH